jgi:hypothetical protein
LDVPFPTLVFLALELFRNQLRLEALGHLGDEAFQPPLAVLPTTPHGCGMRVDRNCPRCRTGWLTHLNGQEGPFMGCDNYPRCRFTVSVDRP